METKLTTYQSSIERETNIHLEAINHLNSFVMKECQSEYEEVKRAKERLQKRLKAVHDTGKCKTLVKNVEEAGDKIAKTSNSIEEEYLRIKLSIRENTSLSESDKTKQIEKIDKAYEDTMQVMYAKYPSLFRARAIVALM